MTGEKPRAPASSSCVIPRSLRRCLSQPPKVIVVRIATTSQLLAVYHQRVYHFLYRFSMNQFHGACRIMDSGHRLITCFCGGLVHTQSDEEIMSRHRQLRRTDLFLVRVWREGTEE